MKMLPPPLPHNNERARLFWTDDNALGVRWSDGGESRFSLGFLRSHCPCAHCKHLRRNPLALHKTPAGKHQEIRALDVQPVGRYAVQISWSDGHNTGIYSYEHLRELSEQNAS